MYDTVPQRPMIAALRALRWYDTHTYRMTLSWRRSKT